MILVAGLAASRGVHESRCFSVPLRHWRFCQFLPLPPRGKLISSIMSGLLGALPSFIWGFDLRRNEVQRAATREAVASGASLTVAYLAMNAAAALIASFGLLQNSPAVIIGAMLIAML